MSEAGVSRITLLLQGTRYMDTSSFLTCFLTEVANVFFLVNEGNQAGFVTLSIDDKDHDMMVM